MLARYQVSDRPGAGAAQPWTPTRTERHVAPALPAQPAPPPLIPMDADEEAQLAALADDDELASF